MMMCTRCKKRPAVVFVSPSTDMNATQGYCLVCAKELGIKPVNDIMEKMGITEEQLEAMTESPADSTKIRELLRQALTDRIDDREMFMKDIDYSYYYESDDAALEPSDLKQKG